MFHLILLSPLLILPLHYSFHSVWLVFLTIVLGCSVSVGHILYKGIPFMTEMSRMNSIFEESFYSIFYTWPFIHHISSFVLGILFGYLVRKHPKLNLGGWLGEVVLTIIFTCCTLFGFYWTQDLLKSNSELTSLIAPPPLSKYHEYEIYLNLTVGKMLWCVGFLWWYYICCTGRWPRLNQIFNWPWLQPFYSLSIGLYLTNFIPILFTTFSTHQVIEFTDFLIVSIIQT